MPYQWQLTRMNFSLRDFWLHTVDLPPVKTVNQKKGRKEVWSFPSGHLRRAAWNINFFSPKQPHRTPEGNNSESDWSRDTQLLEEIPFTESVTLQMMILDSTGTVCLFSLGHFCSNLVVYYPQVCCQWDAKAETVFHSTLHIQIIAQLYLGWRRKCHDILGIVLFFRRKPTPISRILCSEFGWDCDFLDPIVCHNLTTTNANFLHQPCLHFSARPSHTRTHTHTYLTNISIHMYTNIHTYTINIMPRKFQYGTNRSNWRRIV